MLVVEPARGGEVERLMELARQGLGRDADPAWIAAAAVQDACMVARDTRTDEILGFALVRREEGCEGHVLAVAVDRMHRNMGVGGALLKGVHDTMLRTGAMRLRLEVRSDNPRAQAFYTRHGFAPTGLQSRAYADGADAVCFARPI